MEKIKLFNNVPSLYQLKIKVGETNIYMKRDDIIDFAFGGNKVRMFEYIAKKIVDSKVEKIITYGSIHSNHVRVAAVTASKLGIACDIIILCDSLEALDLEGNRKLMDILGANIVYCDIADATMFIDEYLEKQTGKYMWIPGGGHMKEAVYGYIEATEEIKKQSKSLNVKFDAIFLPTGTGTTQAGIIYGMKDCECDIIGITVARTVERCKKEIKNLLEEVCEEENTYNKEFQIQVLDNMKQRYGDIDNEIQELIGKVAREEGIFLDPIYNIKGFAGMLKELEQHSYKNVLYINTGGSPNLFVKNT